MNPLSWQYPANQLGSLCLITEQGEICKYVFQKATPVGWQEALSFNLMLREADGSYNPSYDEKTGKFVLNIPPEHKKAGRIFMLIGIDADGNTVVFPNADPTGETMTVEDLKNFKGYAFSLIYIDTNL